VRPFELVGYGTAAAALLYLRAHGLRFGWESIRFEILTIVPALPFLLGLGLATQLAAHALRRESVRAYLCRVAAMEWLALWCRIWVAGIAFAYSYTWLKVSLPILRPDLFDLELWRLDRWLHFGVAPVVFAVELTAGTPLPDLLDRWYALWVPSIPFVFAFVTAYARSDLRRNFALANCLLWTLGGWLYVAVPALGPCYAAPEILDPVRDEMPRAVTTQRALWAHYGKIVSSRGGVLESFNPSLGVAAMPSLHVAAHWLFALWARRHERRLFLPLALATFLTFFGSLVTAWHYAVDGYAGMLLAWFAVAVADRLEPVAPETGGPAAEPAPAAPPAAPPPPGGAAIPS
jgi:hypothetical protein